MDENDFIDEKDNIYVNATSTLSTYPPNEQSILFFNITGVTLENYVKYLSNIVPLSNILYASRTPDNHIGVILSSKSIVDEIMNKHPFITIQFNTVPICRFVCLPQKIIFDNVQPVIPNTAIIEELEKLNITITSPISKVTFMDRRFINAYTRRTLKRAIYINSNDISKLPEYIMVTFYNRKYRIPISK